MNPQNGLDTSMALALLYGTAATVCVWVENRNGATVNTSVIPSGILRLTAIALLGMAISTLLQLDICFVMWAREVAITEGWYESTTPGKAGGLKL